MSGMVNDKAGELPYLCPQHPRAQIRHLWDQTHYIMNGLPAGAGFRKNHRYECAECGLQVAPPDAPAARVSGDEP